MTNSELFAVIRTKISEVSEIPAPEAKAGAPAHEGKPYRDPYLFVSCPAAKWTDLSRLLKEDPQLDFDFLVMVTAADYLTPEPKMEAIYHLYSFKHRHKIFVKIPLPRENGSVASVISLWKTADWQEREVYDMYGMKFSGHPNMKRILMWDGFPGWPLRKDYAHIPDRYDD
ncbi:MAG: hypothetical protein A2901_08950 [Elusimicrobia bacterium RIFCSPLOWO2_01_FULL_54_10]|nr:MAG: hypothetical protein A2901_08950 [Elusimicrobia bacterium RIFCSPLOWO2_01_FULL_54_10]